MIVQFALGLKTIKRLPASKCGEDVEKFGPLCKMGGVAKLIFLSHLAPPLLRVSGGFYLLVAYCENHRDIYPCKTAAKT